MSAGSLYEDMTCNGFSAELAHTLSYPECELDGEFLGFTDVYKHLAQVIPTDRIVLDFGSYLAVQGYYFRHHRKYIAIDASAPVDYMLRLPNAEYHQRTTGEFLNGLVVTEQMFAICNYVPPWHGEDSSELVKRTFKDVFTFYPRSSDLPRVELQS